MAYTTPWERPYPGISSLPPRDVVRLTVEVLRSDVEAITAVTHTPAILTSIAQKSIKETANVCRAHTLIYADFPRFIDYLRQRSYSELTPSTPSPHVGSGVAGVHEGTEDDRAVAPVVGKTPTGRRVGKSEKGKQ